MAKETPIEMLFVIVSRNNVNNVQDILREFNTEYDLVIMGKGTADSKLGDIFGFGIINRDIVSTLITKTQSKQILDKLDKELQLSTPHNGVAFTIDIDAITSNVLDMFTIIKEKK